MQRRILSIGAIALLFSIFNWGCNKLDTTDIGSDLLPDVDNVNTFDTLLTVNATQGFFDDTTLVTRIDDHVLGRISNDPLFGQTTANIYFQLKPPFYPYHFGNPRDTINNTLIPGTGFDSVVLCINYKGFWGDSSQPLQLEVREIPFVLNNNGLWDSTYLAKNIKYAPATSNILGSTTVDVRTLGTWMKYVNGRDSVRNQIRIKLSTAFANTLFARDTLATGNNSFRYDSLFRQYLNGFAVLANTGNGLIYSSLVDTSTKLEVHFRRRNGGTKIDTSYSSLKLNGNYSPTGIGLYYNLPSVTANNIIRNRVGYPIASPAADEIYLQTSPGTYANLAIPALGTISNRIIHRAELIIEQVPNNTFFDNTFSAPIFLYLDLKDSSVNPLAPKWKTVYFDLNPQIAYDPDLRYGLPFYPGDIDFIYFGGFRRDKTDVFGTPAHFYNFNLTRHVQQIVTKRTTNFDFRLFAPYRFSYPQYTPSILPFNGYLNPLARGRVKVGSGSSINYKMRLRLVYSRI